MIQNAVSPFSTQQRHVSAHNALRHIYSTMDPADSD
jgi:hypothetical protein